jgi:HlyD family secretion protein
MILGRAVLPAVAVLLAIALGWQWLQGVAAVPTGQVPVRIEAGTSGGGPSGSVAVSGRVTAEGRVVAYPGAEVTVGTEVLGTIVSMPVRENASVHKGDLIASLRADEVRASLREAHARLTEAEVGLRLEQARSGLDRILPGLKGQPPQTPQMVRENLTAATARRDAARADVDRLDAEAARYRILAPIDGVVVARHADPGETVAPAAPLVTIVDLTRLRVEAEVDEFDIPRIHIRSYAAIAAEGYRGHEWRGEVEEIAASVVARQTRPADPGRPADTRVLLVKVRFQEPNPLKLGQRVEVEIDGPSTRSP